MFQVLNQCKSISKGALPTSAFAQLQTAVKTNSLTHAALVGTYYKTKIVHRWESDDTVYKRTYVNSTDVSVWCVGVENNEWKASPCMRASRYICEYNCEFSGVSSSTTRAQTSEHQC